MLRFSGHSPLPSPPCSPVRRSAPSTPLVQDATLEDLFQCGQSEALPSGGESEPAVDFVAQYLVDATPDKESQTRVLDVVSPTKGKGKKRKLATPASQQTSPPEASISEEREAVLAARAVRNRESAKRSRIWQQYQNAERLLAKTLADLQAAQARVATADEKILSATQAEEEATAEKLAITKGAENAFERGITQAEIAAQARRAGDAAKRALTAKREKESLMKMAQENGLRNDLVAAQAKYATAAKNFTVLEEKWQKVRKDS